MYKRNIIPRDREIHTLVELISNRNFYRENSENGLSIMVNGSWGSGKTSFVHDLCNTINDDYNVIIYDSFKYDFYVDPFIPIFSFIKDSLSLKININDILQITSKRFIKKAVGFTYNMTNIIVKKKFGKSIDQLKNELTNINDELSKENDVFSDFKKLEKMREKIKNAISDVSNKKPIVLVIDELDRCNPHFAIGTLEIIKYFLDIENLIIVLSLDEKQLQESVKTIYGLGMNSDIYFSKFFDYKFNLSRIKFSQILDKESTKDLPDILNSVDHILESLDISIRDGHKILIEFIRKYNMFSDINEPWTKPQCLFILFMITLKVTDLSFYNSIIHCNYPNYKKVIENDNSIDKKKYLEVLRYVVHKEIPVEECISHFVLHAHMEYLDLKYLSYTHVASIDNFVSKKRVLTKMNLFLPQIVKDESYLQNLLIILNC